MKCVIKDDDHFIHNYSQKKHCLLNKNDIQQDGGIGACQKMRKTE